MELCHHLTTSHPLQPAGCPHHLQGSQGPSSKNCFFGSLSIPAWPFKSNDVVSSDSRKWFQVRKSPAWLQHECFRKYSQPWCFSPCKEMQQLLPAPLCCLPSKPAGAVLFSICISFPAAWYHLTSFPSTNNSLKVRASRQHLSVSQPANTLPDQQYNSGVGDPAV